MKSLCALLAFCLLTSAPLLAQPELQTRDVITGLTVPWEILWGPDGWIWMTERGGRISRVNPETGEQKVLITIGDVAQVTESGLLGMALHPDFADTPWVFVVYTYNVVGAGLREKLARYTYNGTALINPTVLLQDITASSTHDGSRLVILPDHTILMTTGDAQNSAAAQDQTSLNGKVLRMNLDGSAPADNPYADAPFPANLVWTSGHRNPQGLTYAPTGYVYSSEHGPTTDDEINIIGEGENYGWPYVRGFCTDGGANEAQFCADSNVVEPLIAWTPTIAPAGLEYYDNDAIPEWKNSLLLATLNGNGSDLRQLKLNDSANRIISETIFFNNAFGRLRDICIAPDGRVFISTSNRDGRGSPRAGDDRIIEIRAASSATITTGTIAAAQLRAGQEVDVPFTISGTFNAGNVFTAQLSGAGGGFASPQTIGTLNGTAAGTISGRIPCETPPGTAYRIRVVSSNPAVNGSSNGTDITITPFSLVVSAGADVAICEGERTQLGASSSGSTFYRWSPAAGLTCTDCQNPVAAPNRTTTYRVIVMDEFGCTQQDSVTVTVYPTPHPTITLDGTTLTASAAAAYQWRRNGTPINGATAQTYTATASGWYRVVVTSADGCTGESDSVEVTVSSVLQEAGNHAALRLFPDPAKHQLTVQLGAIERGVVEIWVVDLAGRTVVKVKERSTGGTFNQQIDVSQLARGSYLLEVRNGEKTWRGKFVRE